MKAYKVLLFIFAVIALLGLLCLFFPEEGIQIGNQTLRFPTLSEVLSPADEAEMPEESPEELLRKRQEEMRLQQEAEYMRFFRENPARIHFPNDSIAQFDPLFAALDSARTYPMRILHYGDSQIEEDRITNMLRDELQDRFGGSGVGLVPVIQTIPSMSVGQACDTDLPRYMVFGSQNMRAGHRRYGIAGQFVQLDTTATVRFFSRPVDVAPEHARYFDRLTLLVGNVDETLHVSVSQAGSKTVQAPSEDLKLLEFDMPDSTRRAVMTMSGYAELYGVLLDGETGVSVDNIPMRGCSGTVFTGMDKTILRTFCRQKNVRLLILQFGGNSMPYMKTEKQLSAYKSSIIRQINYLKQVAPDACVLFIGPSDMTTRVKGVMQTYPMLPAMVDALKEAAFACDAAYWDLYSAMGGHNSMLAWVKAVPPLASSDHVHFTRLGAEKIGDMFYKSLMLYYDYYRFRNGDTQYLENVELETDTVTVGE